MSGFYGRGGGERYFPWSLVIAMLVVPVIFWAAVILIFGWG